VGFIAVYFDQLIKQQVRFFLKKIGGPEKGRCLCRHCTIHLFIAWLSVSFLAGERPGCLAKHHPGQW
jgi:hypothetical protein